MDAVEEVFNENRFNEYKEIFCSATKTLASDEFGGRFPNTVGEKKTLEFMEEKFKQVMNCTLSHFEIGLEPGNPSKNSYFQEVPLVQVTSKVENDLASLTIENNKTIWKNQEDFVAISWKLTDRIDITNSQLVFAGYGIVAPEYNWDDYRGLDVKGKTVIVMINDPGYQSKDSTFFKGKELTYYGRWTYKYEEAARQGATGIIIIHETAPAAYPWSVVVSSRRGSQLHAVPSDGKYANRCAAEAWITEKTARELFTSLKLDYDILTHKAATKEHSSILLNAYINLTINNTFETFTSNNIVALLRGSERSDEIVIFSAHWDHFGTKGSDIYRGALDNASGCAGLLVLAAAFQKLKKKPARSILFFSSTAEEQGLTGAEYYVENPIFPLNKTVGILNMDMMNVFGRMKDVCFYGWGNSELDKFAEQAAREEGRYISRELKPEDGLFFRSDHYCFCKKKVPGMFLAWSSDVIGQKREDVVKKMEQFTAERYHKILDAFNPNNEWHLDGTIWDFRYLFRFGLNLALSTEFPKTY